MHEFICRIFWYSGLSALGFRIHSIIRRSHVRVFNYHDVPMSDKKHFEAQIDYLLGKYQSITPDQLSSLLKGELNLDKPGIIFTFDDGFVSHATYVADVLSERGIVGWFFVPTCAVSVSPDAQMDWALENQIFRKDPKTFGLQVFGSWEQWREVLENHVIASHTHDHLRFESKVSEKEVERQLRKSMDVLKQELRIENRTFCYVGGELTSYTSNAARTIKSLGIELAFTTCSKVVTEDTDPRRVERTNIESHFSIKRVAMCCSGIVDLRYFMKRRKLNKVFR